MTRSDSDSLELTDRELVRGDTAAISRIERASGRAAWNRHEFLRMLVMRGMVARAITTRERPELVIGFFLVVERSRSAHIVARRRDPLRPAEPLPAEPQPDDPRLGESQPAEPLCGLPRPAARDSDELYIANIATAPELRRRGVASFALTRIEERARTRGLARVALHVHETNLHAQLLYRKHGYRAVEIERDFYRARRAREHAYRMEKTVAARASDPMDA